MYFIQRHFPTYVGVSLSWNFYVTRNLRKSELTAPTLIYHTSSVMYTFSQRQCMFKLYTRMHYTTRVQRLAYIFNIWLFTPFYFMYLLLVLCGVAVIWFLNDDPLGIETCSSVYCDIVIYTFGNNVVYFVGLWVVNWLSTVYGISDIKFKMLLIITHTNKCNKTSFVTAFFIKSLPPIRISALLHCHHQGGIVGICT
jgi:hypothetical protein